MWLEEKPILANNLRNETIFYKLFFHILQTLKKIQYKSETNLDENKIDLETTYRND